MNASHDCTPLRTALPHYVRAYYLAECETLPWPDDAYLTDAALERITEKICDRIIVLLKDAGYPIPAEDEHAEQVDAAMASLDSYFDEAVAKAESEGRSIRDFDELALNDADFAIIAAIPRPD